MSNLRSEPSFQWGEFKSNVKGSVFYYTRQAEGFDGYLVALNFGSPSTVDFTGEDMLVPAEGVVATSTQNFREATRHADFEVGTKMGLTNVHLREGEGIIVKWAADSVPPAKSA